MKLAHQQLEQHLAKQLAPIYLISTDELLLSQEAVERIRLTAEKNGFAERIRIAAEGADWGKQLYAQAHSLSLFSAKQILELDLRGAKLNQATTDILKDYAAKPLSDTLLIIQTHKLEQKTEQSAWYKACEKTGVTLPIWPINREQLPAWILARAKKSGLTLAKPAADWLAEQVEGNLFAAAQEIEKLCLLQTSDALDECTLEKMISNNARFDIFNLVESMLLGNTARSLKILANLREEDTELTLLLWALSRELRTMAEIAKQLQQGIALSQLFSQFRIWEKRQPSVRAFLKRNSYEKCCQFLLVAAKIDRLIKGAEIGNAWDELERLLFA